MRRQLLPALRMLLVMTVLTGIAYPLAVTAIAQTTMPDAANGSLVERDGEVVGSRLQAQAFTRPEYFTPRPSAAGDGYDGSSTSGSNLGPTNPELLELVARRTADYRAANGLSDDVEVPVDAVTASGSGLDPDISLANARLQAGRVAQARGLAVAEVQALVDELASVRLLGVLGERHVNVLALNLALDEAT